MSDSKLNHLELMAELERRGWTWLSLVDWLRFVDHAILPAMVQQWTDRASVDAGAEVPRWPFLLMQGLLGPTTGPTLRHFKAAEFGNWWPWMHPALLQALDVAREVLDAPLKISATNGALGRHLQTQKSMHNVDRLGYVMAADVILPPGFPLGMAFELVMAAGIVSGLGIYPDWKQGPGLHLDVRHLTGWNETKGATLRSPATWSGVAGPAGGQVYHSAAYALLRT